jgi:hypothetical protein
VQGLLDDCCCKHFGLQRDGMLQARVRNYSWEYEGVRNNVYLVVVVVLVRTVVEVVRRTGRVEGSIRCEFLCGSVRWDEEHTC